MTPDAEKYLDIKPTNPKAEKPVKSALELVLGKYYDDPVEGGFRFMRDELKYIPDACLIPSITDVFLHKDTPTKSSRGTGKTAGASCTALTLMPLTPELLIAQLSPTWRQVKQIFWNEVRKWYANSSILKAMFEIADKAPEMRSRAWPQLWYMIGMASRDPGTIEGFHGAKRVHVMTDETKTIPDEMIDAIMGTLTAPDSWESHWSTPSPPAQGYTFFHNAFTRERAHYSGHSITAEESPRVSKDWVEKMIRRYGIDSPFVRAQVFAEFPEIADDMLIGLRDAEAFFVDEEAAIEWRAEPLAIGVDVARFGMDETVIAMSSKKSLLALDVYTGKATGQVAHEAWAKAKQTGALVIVVDDIGVGGGVTDRLVELSEAEPGAGHKPVIVGFNASQKAINEDLFKIIGDEVWYEFAQDVKEGRYKSIFHDDDLLWQLSSYKKNYTADNRIKIEWPKRKERQSESNSPDRADATVLSWYGARLAAGARIEGTIDHSEDETDTPAFSGIERQRF